MNVERRELGRATGTRKVQKVVNDVCRPVRLPPNLLQQGVLRIVLRQHVQKHLRVRRDSGERRVHFVRDAGGEQTDGRKFLALLQLIFKTQTFRYIFENHECAGLLLRVRPQRRNGNIQHQRAPFSS